VAGDPDRQGTLIDIISMENWRICVCYTFVVKPVVSVETRITRTDFPCHLVAVRGIEMWECDISVGRTEATKV
jgi:hypothetical protein